MFEHLPLLLDGATGTQLQKRGMPAGCCSEQWILEHPETITEIQKLYCAAGSDMVYAPTFGANPASLRAHGLDGVVQEYNTRLAALSREAAGEGCLIGGDISSCGLMPVPLGETSFDELVENFAAQVAALDAAGVDFFAVETQMGLVEARAAVTAVRSISDKPFVVSFTCGPTGRTIMGGSLVSALVTMQDMGASAFGINCLGDLDLLERVLGELRPYAAIPLIAKPNAGLPEQINGQNVYRLTPEELAARVPRLMELGVGLIGGCCGTTEAHIAALRTALEGAQYQPNPDPIRAVATSEFEFVELGEDNEIAGLEITEDIAEDAMDAEDEGAQLLRVSLRSMQDVEILEQNQFSLRLPLCVDCEDEAVLRRFLRVYCGKPVIL